MAPAIFPASVHPVPSADTNLVFTLISTLRSYKDKALKDLAFYPLFTSFQRCDSPEAVVTILREQIPVFSQSRNDDDGFLKWAFPTVNVLCSFQGSFYAAFDLNFGLSRYESNSVIFAGIVLVSVLHGSFVWSILTPVAPRWLKIPTLAKTS